MIKRTWRYFFRHRYLMTKYATVGSLTAVLDFGLLYILTDIIGLHYLLSATISFIIAGSTNYWFNRNWTFNSNGEHKKQLPIFFTVAVIGLILNNNIIYLSVEKFHLHYLLGKIIAAGIVLFWNFFCNKYLTFRKNKKTPQV